MAAPRNGTGAAPERPLLPLLERAIAKFSPALAHRRAVARWNLLHVATALRRYEGAGSGRRFDERVSGAGNADGETRSSLKKLRERSRALCRDTPYGRRVVNQWAAWLVGQGWAPALDDEDPRAKVWKLWAETTSCDVEGVNNFRALQRVIARCWFESGEVLILRRFAPEEPIPFQLAIYEPDYLDDSRDGKGTGGGTVTQGVERDANGRVRGYWLFNEHPGSNFGIPGPSTFYPAEDVIHLFLRDRAGQGRGVPVMAAIVLRMNDWDQLCDAKVVQQKAGASFVGIERDLSTDPPMNPEEGKEPTIRDLEPGSIVKAPAGKTIEFNDTPDPGPFDLIASEFLHELAAGTDLPYEILSGNLVKMSFSSARIGYFPFYVVLDDVQQAAFVPLLLNRLGTWLAEAALLRGIAGFTPENPLDWTPPARPAMDPQAEANATVTNIRGGLETLSDALRARGKNPRRHLERLAADWALIDSLKLSLDCDPRKFGKTASGGGSDVMAQSAATAAAAAGVKQADAEDAAAE